MEGETKKSSTPQEEFTLHYKKTDSYRTYSVDGAFGGLTSQNKLYLELFIERHVTPISVTHKVTKDGRLGEVVSQEAKQGGIRQIEAGLIMDLKVAQALRDFIDTKITEYLQTMQKKK